MTVWEKDVSPGEKKWVEIPVPGGEVLRGMCLRGASSGPRLVVTAGVHGCEYVGVEALRRLIKELEPGEMKGSVFLLPLANPQGFYAGAKQVVPEDKVNLNRAFPGSAPGQRRLPSGLGSGAHSLSGSGFFGRSSQRRLQ